MGLNLLFWLFITYLFEVNIGLDCSQYKTQATCENGSCLWLPEAGTCQCTTETKIDIYFGVDKSGSITASGFEVERDFLIGLAQGVLPLVTTRIGFIEFSDQSSVTQSLRYWDQSSLVNFINNIQYIGGYTNTRDLLKQTRSEFQTYNNPYRSNILILITDGNPCEKGNCPYDVCDQAAAVKALDIRVILMLVGPDIDEERLDCLTLDPFSDPNPDVIRVAAFTNNAFDNILPQISDIVCPVDYSLTITEVGPMTALSANTPGGYISRFVEFYNNGVTIPLSAIVSEGFIITTDTSAGLGLSTEKIPQNTYAVFYDSDEFGVTCNHPKKQCNCTIRTNNIWCSTSEATYIPCCAGGSCVCSFDDTMTKNSWNVGFLDNSDQSNFVLIDQVTRDSSFPLIADGYKYELIDKTAPNDIGGNWKESCYITGTPGADPIDKCAACTQNINGTCVMTNGTCNSITIICNCKNGYYSTGTQCIIIPPPTTCIVTITKDYTTNSIGIERAVFEWSPALTSLDKRYILTVPTIDGSATSTFTTYARTQIVPNTEYQSNLLENTYYGWIQTEIPPESGSLSVLTRCEVYTAAPSPSPTPSPTGSPTPSPTGSPTSAPTGSPRIVCLNVDSCSLPRCECSDYPDDLGCCNNTLWTTTTCSNNVEDNIISIFERTAPWILNVLVIPSVYLFDATILWKVEWQYDIYENKLNTSDTFRDYNTSMNPAVGISPSGGNVTFDISVQTGKVAISLNALDDITKFNRRRLAYDITPNNYNIYSIYKLYLVSCEESYQFADCILVYPSQQYLSLQYGRRQSLVTEKNIPKWVLPLVFGLLGFGLILGILLWAVWKMNAKKVKQVDQNYNEIGDAYNELNGNLGDDVNVGDINANKLATGVPGLHAGKQDFDTQIKERAKNNNEFAHQDAPKFVQRQEMGPQQGNIGYQPPQNI